MNIGWGIDVGVASLGFAVLELDEDGQPTRIIDGVSKIYPAPVGAAERTRFRSIRTQNRRRRERMKALRQYLTGHFGLNPDFDEVNAWPDLPDGKKTDGKPRRNTSRIRLRAHGLSGELTRGDLSRAVMHIAKNRGIRLTRGLKDAASGDVAAAKKAEKERTSTADTANETKARLTRLGAELGMTADAHPSQLLEKLSSEQGYSRLKKGRPGAPVLTRSMVEREFAAFLLAQKKFHASLLTDEAIAHLQKTVFHEEDARPPEIGKCRYEVLDADGEVERRLPRGTDLFTRKRIYEEVNNLRLISVVDASEKCLTLGQRDHIAGLLLAGENVSAARLRKELGLAKTANAERTSLDVTPHGRGRKTAATLGGHPIAAAMKKAGELVLWEGLDAEQREAIAEIMRTEDDVDKAIKDLQVLGISEETAAVLSEARVPAPYSAAGKTATAKLLEQLEADVISNFEAEERAGLKTHGPELPRLDNLPYYGELFPLSCTGETGNLGDHVEKRYGRIPNPVVHVALNQIRKTANAYLDLYGKPRKVRIELARDMNKSAKAREDAENEAIKNRGINQDYIEEINFKSRKLSPGQRTRIKLHRMQDGECLYTGKCISPRNILDGTVEVDHILSHNDTLDDGIANLALVVAKANQDKAKRTPFEAFSAGYDGKDYQHILRRAWKRGPGVYWRFQENAMERFRDANDFPARFMNDTRYIAKVAAQYLSCVTTASGDVISLNGRITAILRHNWGLSTLIRDIMIDDGRLDADEVARPKDGETLKKFKVRAKKVDKIRWDHRHHLLDAIVAGCTTVGDVQRLQTLSGLSDEGLSARSRLEKLRRENQAFKGKGICWDSNFRNMVREFLTGNIAGNGAEKERTTAVVRKANHDVSGKLHDATNYGVICEVPNRPGQFVTRDHVQIESLGPDNIEKLEVPPTAINAIERAHADGLKFWWGGADPVSAIKMNVCPDTDRLRHRLLGLMKGTPSENLDRARTEEGEKKARALWATKSYVNQTGRRRFTRIQIQSLRILKGPLHPSGRIRQATPTNANDRIVYFRNDDGSRDLEVVSTLDANNPHFMERWRCVNGRHLFTLRINDLVEMLVDPNNPSRGRGIFRLVKFSYLVNLDIEFLPIEEARAIKQVPKNIRTRITSMAAFEEREPTMILFDQTGRIRWRSPRSN